MNCDKKSSIFCSPSTLHVLVRIGIFILFFFPGLQKIQDPSSFIPMIEGAFGLSGTAAVVVAWLVIVAEVFGALAVLLGKWVPKSIYKLSIFGLLLTSLGVVYVKMGDPMMWPNALLYCLVLAGLFCSPPMDSTNITGYKCLKGACDASNSDDDDGVVVIDA